ncbi:hypothetical protein BDB01DRAFT_775648 [Pilobolus umbonatus]|nr:hypothetical protein BDB01DRAFT_775648 [Pilobolus umbonatus]
MLYHPSNCPTIIVLFIMTILFLQTIYLVMYSSPYTMSYISIPTTPITLYLAISKSMSIKKK